MHNFSLNKMQDLLPFEKIKKEIITVRKTETSSEFGCIPEKRVINNLINYGIININKPSGPTSHQISDYIQKILNISKAGHSGTLDPKVTGVLPMALGRATRIVQVLLKAGKEYVGIMHLHKKVPLKKILETVEGFTGKINQFPPKKSAIKRRLRQREIYYFKILEVDEKDILFKVGCEAGTYIRKLCFDFGKKLGIGAHMLQLVRTKAGPFNEKDWHSMQDLKDAYEIYKQEKDERPLRNVILPMEYAVKHLNKIWVSDKTINSLCHGADLYSPGIVKLNKNIEKNELIAIMTLKDELIGLAKIEIDSSKILEKKKGLIAKTKKIFMERNTYK